MIHVATARSASKGLTIAEASETLVDASVILDYNCLGCKVP